MKRAKLDDLVRWKEDPGRKPLILQGARQTGKTWLLKDFGGRFYRKVVYLNFEETPSLQTLFRNDFDIRRILTTLQIHADLEISADDTLIIFDEIQTAEKGMTSLKYFCENSPQHHVVAAGSLLGMGLHSGESYPVGKVSYLNLRPLSFGEFLTANGEEKLAMIVQAQDWPVVSAFHEKLNDYLKYYFFTGGMPAVVKLFTETRNLAKAREVQKEILHSYEGDFSKHIPYDLLPRIRMVWQSIPSQLARENRKFIFGMIREGARAKDFELAIQWLADSGLLLKLHRISKPALPLAAYQDAGAFKLFLSDIGLLGAMAELNQRTILEGNAVFTEFKGALTEQFVMQQLRAGREEYIGYWTNERSKNEVDFIVQEEGTVIPIEVKSGENTRSKSFRLFYEKFRPGKAIRASLLPYRKEEWMENIPLYAI